VRQRPFPTSVTAGADVTLRLARDGDAETISEMTHSRDVHQFWGGRPVTAQEALVKYAGRRAPEVVSYVICEGARSVGYLQAWQRDGRYGIDMFIAAEAQGRGIGPRAARAIAGELTRLGWTPLTADPVVDNPRALNAWRAAGFEATGEMGEDEGKATQIMCFPPTAQGSA
jgi:aminoglycoside 6'-N-acetyltransferase